MNADVQQYLSAADRENTVRSYAAAIRHFEVDWKGLLPATIDTVARPRWKSSSLAFSFAVSP